MNVAHLLIIVFIMLIVLLMLILPHVLVGIRYARWQRQLDLPKHAVIFKALYQPINGFLLSKRARVHQDAFDYFYGEIDFHSFIALLFLTHLNRETIFYDLGSGTGKAVLASAMVFDVKRSIGIELFKELHEAAKLQQEKLKNHSEYKGKAARITFLNEDFLAADFSDATLIFINATSFIGPTWQRLCKRLERVKTNTRVITTSKQLQATHFSLESTHPVRMSWGIVQAYIYRRN